jgi:hypothetical protein
MTDQPIEDREEAPDPGQNDLQPDQTGKGFGEDEGERERGLPDESE